METIGGYLSLDEFVDNTYHKDLIKLNTGRNALLYLVKARKIKKLYIPYFLCDSIKHVLSENNIAYEHYHIDEHLLLKCDIKLEDDEYILIVNYYGQLSDDKIRELNKHFKRIILDNTQAFFQKPIAGIDTFYSCRKYFGVPDGAYLKTTAVLNEELITDISNKRMKHILGRYEENAEDHYQDFRDNEQVLRSLPLMKMSKLTENILRAIDYKLVLETRNINYACLADALDKTNRLKVEMVDGPFAYPYLVNDGFKVRSKLQEKHIYIPALWPNVIENCAKDSIEYDLAANILPLPCDQRYKCAELGSMISEIERCIL